METTKVLNKLIEKQDLSTEETKDLLTHMMNGDLLPSQVAAVLTALRMKGETVDEIIGFIKSMREQMISVDIREAIDVCGTGGDRSSSFNISTAVSFVVAGAGVKIAKHGNRAASSQCGSADVMDALGVNINLSSEQAKKVLEKTGMVFLFAPNFHPATKTVAVTRKELKIRTVFNYLGPFLNPASVNKQLIGVPNIEVAKKLILVGKKLGYKHLLIISSMDGMDEISLSAKTQVFELKNNKIKRYFIDPKEYGYKKVSKKEITGGSAKENAEIMKNILNGRKGAKRDIVVLNSAVALYVAGKVSNIKDGISIAERSIDSGKARQILDNLIKETKKYA